MRARSVIAPVALALAAAGARAADAPYQPHGEVRFHASGGAGGGASFDDRRVVGPNVNLTFLDGAWIGNVAGEDVRLSGNGSKLSGPNVTLTFKQKGEKTEVEGLFHGTRVRLSVDARKLKGRYGACSFDLKRAGPPMYSGDVSCGSRERAFGEGDRVARPYSGTDDGPGKGGGLAVPPRPQSASTGGKAAVELRGSAAGEAPPPLQLGLALMAVLPR